MRSGPERAPGIDDDGNDVPGRTLPRWADPQRPDAHGPMELPPAILPTGVDVLHARARRRLVIGVRGELDLAAQLDFLEALGEAFQPGRPCLLGTFGRHADRDPFETSL